MTAAFDQTTIGVNGKKQPNDSYSSRLQSNRELLEEQYPDFPRTWVPLGSTRELDPDRPNRVEFLGQSYVAFFSNSTQQWVVMDNTCPHRLAPLSEGRVEPETGRLQCSYHGWTFESDGSCQRIPQATPAVADAILQNSRACVPSYTTNADPQTGILWIWPWQQDVLSVAGEEWRHPEGMMKNILGLDSTMDTNATVMTYTRDQPYVSANILAWKAKN
jgi:pheophorbide a oxygenase